MHPASYPLSLPGAASKARYRRTVGRHEKDRRLLVGALIVWSVLAVSLLAGAAQLAVPGKKLIEYGWGVPTPAQKPDELAAMEKRPFDGLIFRLNEGHNAFATRPLEPASFAEDECILRNLQFTSFRDNFVLVWGSPPADFDWFDDTQWRTIEANARLLVGIAQAGHVLGTCFDPEPYDFSLWDYAKQPGTNSHAFAKYRAKMRHRAT